MAYYLVYKIPIKPGKYHALLLNTAPLSGAEMRVCSWFPPRKQRQIHDQPTWYLNQHSKNMVPPSSPGVLFVDSWILYVIYIYTYIILVYKFYFILYIIRTIPYKSGSHLTMDMTPTCTDWSNLAAASWRSISCSNPTSFSMGEKKPWQKTPSKYYTLHMSFLFFPGIHISILYQPTTDCYPHVFLLSLALLPCLLLLLLLFVSGLFFDPFLFFPLLSDFESTCSVFNWWKYIWKQPKNL